MEWIKIEDRLPEKGQYVWRVPKNVRGRSMHPVKKVVDYRQKHKKSHR